MIILMIMLLSLSAIYFTRLLSKKSMRAASASVAVLYIYLICWTFAIFIIDISDLGFSDAETSVSLLHGSNIYHSFVRLTEQMSVVPLQVLNAIVVVVAVTLAAALIVVFHGLFEVTKQICKYVRESLRLFKNTDIWNTNLFEEPDIVYPILRMNCRANC